jgi:cell division protein FtsX
VTRQKEMAIRSALGASGARLTRQMVTETLLLSVCGGFAGLLLANWLVHLFRSLNLVGVIGQIARVSVIRIDSWVFGFAMLVSLLTGLFFGLLPTLRLSQPNLDASLREGARSGKSQGKGLRSALLVSEVAVAIVLLAGAGLLLRSYAKLTGVNPGFRAENLLTAQLRLPPRYDDDIKRVQFYDRLLENAAALPGVESVGITSQRNHGTHHGRQLRLLSNHGNWLEDRPPF